MNSDNGVVMQTQTSKVEVMGNFVEYENVRTQVRMNILPSDMGGYWNRCGLTADFGAAFMAYCHPNHSGTRNTLSFILNEMVENAVKFTASSEKSIGINLFENDHQVIFEVENVATGEECDHFRSFFENYILNDLDDTKYLELIEHQAEDAASSRLGLITIIKNFNAAVGLCFKGPDPEHLYSITTRVTINPLEI